MGNRWKQFIESDLIKCNIINTNRQIGQNKKVIMYLEKEIQSTERQLFYFKGLKEQLGKEIKSLEEWGVKLIDKINEESNVNKVIK